MTKTIYNQSEYEEMQADNLKAISARVSVDSAIAVCGGYILVGSTQDMHAVRREIKADFTGNSWVIDGCYFLSSAENVEYCGMLVPRFQVCIIVDSARMLHAKATGQDMYNSRRGVL